MEKTAYTHSRTWLLADHQPVPSISAASRWGAVARFITPTQNPEPLATEKGGNSFPKHTTPFLPLNGAGTFVFLRGNPTPISTEWTLDPMA